MPPIVALLTDFGTQDHYAGAVKGAILTVCPEATVVDVAHDLPPHDVGAAAFSLLAVYRSFPAGAVFLVVVDPGVGSDRRGLALEAGGYRFVGPDNGLFTLVLAEEADPRIHQLSRTDLFRPQVSTTFHARDVFGPVAGHLARGLALAEVGEVVTDPVRLPFEAVRRLGPGEWEAVVLHVDRFGNLTTNLTAGGLQRIVASGDQEGAKVVVMVEGVVLPLARTYADVPEGEACALLGSSGRLEVAVSRGNAARVLGAGKGTPVRLRAVRTAGSDRPSHR